MSIIVEGKKSIHIASAAMLVEENRELAWAEKHVIANPALAWIVGKYIGTNKPNDNGHIFNPNEIGEARQSLVYAPMNMLHRPQQVMGVYVANEIIWPTAAGQDGYSAAELHDAHDVSQSATAAAGVPVTETEPFLEAVAAFYKYYFPEQFEAVRMAHNEGSLAWSMECVPATVTCADGSGCDQTFAYMGRQDPSYCDHLNQPGALKKLNKPHFTAGALVLPPARPAWRGANVTELSTMVRTELEAAESIYDQTAKEFPEMEAKQWETVMATLVAQMVAADQKKVGKHPYAASDASMSDSSCKVCGQMKGAPIHDMGKGGMQKAARIGRQVATKP